MRLVAVYGNDKPEATVTWNVGIDIPNGIRNMEAYAKRVASTGQHPDVLSFHVHSDLTLSEVVAFVTDLLRRDREENYRYTPLHMVYDIANVYATASDMLTMFELHFKAKRQALGIPDDAWVDQEY